MATAGGAVVLVVPGPADGETALQQAEGRRIRLAWPWLAGRRGVGDQVRSLVGQIEAAVDHDRTLPMQARGGVVRPQDRAVERIERLDAGAAGIEKDAVGDDRRGPSGIVRPAGRSEEHTS